MTYYNDQFARLIGNGVPRQAAVENVAGSYLEGKPSRAAKSKLSRKARDTLFWASNVVKDAPPEAWGGEAMSLALTRYLAQEPVVADGLVMQVARAAPEALIRAIRQSGLVLRPQSARRAEVDLAATISDEVAELCRVLDLFSTAHEERMASLEVRKASLAGLSAFDLLLYASLYAFEMLVPRDLQGVVQRSAVDLQTAWDALDDLLAWKLEGESTSSLKLTNEQMGKSIAQHLRPILFEESTEAAGDAQHNLSAFHALMDAQIELNELISRSANAFSYDDSIRFVREGHRLEIVEEDPERRAAWMRDGQKLDRIHHYWFRRAVESYVEQVAADPTMWPVGRPENQEANRIAWLRATQAHLRLREAYGVADEVTSDSGGTVDLFQALLSLNLMSAFFLKEFLVPFAKHLYTAGDWLQSLQRLAMSGLPEGQNRLPLTWSSHDAKVANIVGWTATKSEPAGNSRKASAILDFWAHDMVASSERIQRKEAGIRPALFERPILKFGAALVQLPWMVGMQNNTSAAINNLRRLGARREQARQEAERIEATLAKLLEKRGFCTLSNWVPPNDADGAGEVDVIAARDGHLFILEVKSTFMRRSQQDAWLHATTTLRKAGQQLRRKTEAVRQANISDPAFCEKLGLTHEQAPIQYHGWIADTSIECDHQRFAGFLKVSVEELMIALRDDRHLLNDQDGFLPGEHKVQSLEPDADGSAWTLYPGGFSVERFIEVIEKEAVWEA